jgi:hypothetical protein
MTCAILLQLLYTVKPPFQVSLGTIKFDHYIVEILIGENLGLRILTWDY